MLEFLGMRTSERKRRLFACACCREVWHLLADERGRHALETAEQFADGQASKAELRRARRGVRTARDNLPVTDVILTRDWAAYWAVEVATTEGAYWHAPRLVPTETGSEGAPPAAQAALLRHLMGNPFRPVTIDSAWLAWKDGTVIRLAEAIYQERRFEDLPILADALEESGCTDPDLLGHLRGPGPHLRGCWLVDALLRKE
jgi:hypothetical protein